MPTKTVEYKRVNNSTIIYVYEFEDLLVSNQTHNYTIDKWLSIEDWNCIYKKLEKFIDQTCPNESYNGEEKKITLKNKQIVMLVKWQKKTKSLIEFANVENVPTNDYFLNIKVQSNTKLTALIENLQDEIEQLKKQRKESDESKPSLETIDSQEILVISSTCKSTENDEYTIPNVEEIIASNAIAISSQDSQDQFRDQTKLNDDIDDEYCPEMDMHSSIELPKYKPKNSSSSMSILEYIPKASKKLNFKSSFDESNVYQPGGPSSFQHEQYTPNPANQSNDSATLEYIPSKGLVLTSANNNDKNQSQSLDSKANSDIESVTSKRKLKKLKKQKRQQLSPDLFGDSSASETEIKTSKKIKKTKLQVDAEKSGEEQLQTPQKYQTEDEKRKCPSRKVKTYNSLNEVALTPSFQNIIVDRPISSQKKSMHKSTKDQESPEPKTSCKLKKRKTKCEMKLDSLQNIMNGDDMKLMSPEEVARYNEEHAKTMQEIQALKEQLKLLDPVLPNVKILTLKEMLVKEFIGTYDKYRKPIQDFIQRYIKRTSYKFPPPADLPVLICGTLMTNTQKLAIMDFLEKKYRKSDDELSGLSELFGNIVLPEWILWIFMEKYNFSRKEAIDRLILQNKIEAQNLTDSEMSVHKLKI